MVNGVNWYSNSTSDLFTQQAQKRANWWAQQSAQTQQAAQPQQGYVQQTVTAPQTGQVSNEESIMTNQKPSTSNNNGCTDGKDDGKIGFWQSLKHFGKGVLKFAGGLIGFDEKGDFSLGRLFKNVVIGAAVGAVCVLTAGTAVPAIIAGAGVAAAAGGIAKSQYQFWTAKTDAEARAAMEGTGSNTVALGLSLVGAKASMKQVPGVDATKYDGVMGTLRAGWDSTTIGFKQGWKGIKSTYSAAKVGGWQGVKTLTSNSWGEFKTTVANNWNAVKVPTLQESQEVRMQKYDSQIAKLKEQAKAAKDAKEVGVERSLNKRIQRLEAEKANVETAYNEINAEKSLSNARMKISEIEAKLAEQQARLAAGPKHKLPVQYEINRLQQKLDIYNNVVNSKTTLARNLRSEISKVKEQLKEDGADVGKLTAKLRELQTKQTELDFGLPTKSSSEIWSKKVTESTTDLLKKQKAHEEAQAKLTEAETANKAFAAGDPSDEAMLAQLRVDNAKAAVNNARLEMEAAQRVCNTNKALSNATGGADYVSPAMDKAFALGKAFNNLYGSSKVRFVGGSKIPFTDVKIPSTLPKSWVIPATNEFVNPTVGGPSIESMLQREMYHEASAQLKQAGFNDTEINAILEGKVTPEQIIYKKNYEMAMAQAQNQMFNTQALAAAQAQAQAQAAQNPQASAQAAQNPQASAQTAANPRSFLNDSMALDQYMKGMGIIS